MLGGHNLNCDFKTLIKFAGTAHTLDTIYEDYPKLMEKPVCLAETACKYRDHLGPWSWDAKDLCVDSVVVHNCWTRGQPDAIAVLSRYGYAFDFTAAYAEPNVDHLCPFGQYVEVLLNNDPDWSLETESVFVATPVNGNIMEDAAI